MLIQHPVTAGKTDRHQRRDEGIREPNHSQFLTSAGPKSPPSPPARTRDVFFR